MLQKKYLILTTLGFISLASCGKKFLDKKPLAVVNDENYYKTNEQMISAVNAAYDPLNWQTDRSASSYCNDFFYGDVASDDSRKGGSDLADQASVNAIEMFYVDPTNQQLRLTWSNAYRGIYLANVVLEKSPKSNAEPAVKQNVEGQALFLRAYYHFKLANIFGGVPLVTKVLQQGEFEFDKSTKQQVYTQVESDLLTAISKLPNRTQTQEGRATKGAARALLMRVYLYQSKWQEIKTQYELFELENNNQYQLEPIYADIFSVSKVNGKESVFAIQGAGIDNGDPDGGNFGRKNEGLLYATMCAPRSDYGGWGFNRPTENLVAEFLTEKSKAGKNDPRLMATVVSNGDTIGGKPLLISIKDSTDYPYTRHFNRKYVLDALYSDMWNAPLCFITIRYADVLLMAAEAYNELGDNANSLIALNKVRARANMFDVSETDIVNLRNIIWRERRVELALEGLRFFDLVRQGRAAKVLKATGDVRFPEGQGFVEGKNEVFPIPQTQIDLSNGKLTQNPGY